MLRLVSGLSDIDQLVHAAAKRSGILAGVLALALVTYGSNRFWDRSCSVCMLTKAVNAVGSSSERHKHL